MALERVGLNDFVPRWVREEHRARYLFASRFVPGRRILDCASGSGEGAHFLLKSGATTVKAFDVCEKAVWKAKKHFGGKSLDFEIADACQLPIESASIDVYISFETIEHLDDDRRYLSEAARILKPGGIFLCSTPNRLLTNPGKSLRDKPWNPFHRREYTSDELSVLLKDFFSEIRWFGQNPEPAWQTGSLKNLRFRQFLKIPYFFLSSKKRAWVRPIETGFEYEYLVAVCKK